MQLFTKTIVTAVAIVFLGSVAGCATQQAAKSGFLRDYSQLKPDPAFDGARRYQNPAKPLKQYQKFMVDPVVVHFAPNAEGTAISSGELKELADYFHNRAVEELSKRYQVVQKPSPLPQHEIVMHRAFGRQVLGQRRTLAARPKNIEDPVEHLAEVHVAWPTATTRRRNQRLDQQPFRIRQIARVTRAAAVGGSSVFRRPHRAPLGNVSRARQ